MYGGNVLFIYDDSFGGSASARWLSHWPARALADAGYFVDIMSLMDALKGTRLHRRIIERADIILYERHIDDPWIPFLEWVAANKRLVLVVDDAYWACDPSTKTYQFWSKNDRLDKLKHIASIAERVVAPSRKLAAYFPNGLFRPNRPNFTDPCWSVPPLFSENVILWGGTSGHIAGIRDHPALHAVKDLCEEEVARFIAITDSPAMQAEIKAIVPSVTLMPSFREYPEWLKIVSGATIFICPLGEGYDSYRSWIKALEAAAVGVSWVASDRGVYDDVVGGVLVKDRQDLWYDQLFLLLCNEEMRRGAIEQGMRWAWRQGVHDHLDEWEALFSEH